MSIMPNRYIFLAFFSFLSRKVQMAQTCAFEVETILFNNSNFKGMRKEAESVVKENARRNKSAAWRSL
jgi:hypothetical protein